MCKPSALTACSIHTYHAAEWHGAIHQVLLSDLPPMTRFYYRVGDAKAGWSDTYSFQTQPAPGDTSTHVYGIFGDMGTVPRC